MLFWTDGTLDIVYQFYCASVRFNRLIEFHRLVHTHVPTHRSHQCNVILFQMVRAIFHIKRSITVRRLTVPFQPYCNLFRRIKTQPFTSTSLPTLTSATATATEKENRFATQRQHSRILYPTDSLTWNRAHYAITSTTIPTHTLSLTP